MSLSKKTFLYSIVLAVIMAAFITGYFTLMLPVCGLCEKKRSGFRGGAAKGLYGKRKL